MVARQFRVLEAASSSPATSTKNNGAFRLLYFLLDLTTKNSADLQSKYARLCEQYKALIQLHEPAKLSSESRHFDQK